MIKDKNTRVDVRMRESEKRKLQELAKDRGLTMSEYIKEKLFGRKVTVRWKDRGEKDQAEMIEID